MRILSSVLSLLFLMGNPAQAKENKMELSFDVKLIYGPDPADMRNRVDVLNHTYIFSNNSKTQTYHLSLWDLRVALRSISPANAVKSYPYTSAGGMPSPPTKDQYVILKPGQKHEVHGWYWPKKDLLWPAENLRNGYALKKNAELEMVFCVELHDHQDVFKVRGIKTSGELVQAKLCTKPVTFNFQILMNDD